MVSVDVKHHVYLLTSDTDSLHSLITPPGVAPVPSTVSPMVGPVLGFTVGRPLSGRTNRVKPLCQATVYFIFFLSAMVSLYLDSQYDLLGTGRRGYGGVEEGDYIPMATLSPPE